MSTRGLTQKTRTDKEMMLERAMVTRHYVMRWDLERCVGCQMGPLVCPKDALVHIDGVIENGRLVQKQSVDVDPQKCILCGECVEVCPVNAIEMTINGQPEIPVIKYEAFPVFEQSTTFDPEAFDWSKKDFVIENCPTDVISENKEKHTLEVDDVHCIRCRQCEIASEGAFHVLQPWQGSVTLKREFCVEGCLACADICPTRALHVNDAGELVLADYYCIKCGACVQTCPVEAQYEEYEVKIESQGVTKVVKHRRVTNSDKLPVWVERWRVRHQPVKSGAWVQALLQMADEKAEMVEIDRKRALKRRDLILALKGGNRQTD
ncbi:MAG: 4Fe-4S dicluster domain-containing protein [Anaerolineaceae bacterium]|jgi:ferredoxin|nr:MAG: 4Fe-4S dicluster domain-containing protein [Anaerolineaceae bacterium]